MKIKFIPMDKEIEADSTKSVLELAKDHGIQIKSVCGGTPACAECRVQITEGEHNLLPPSEREVSLIGSAHFVDRSRLACQMVCFGDVTIDMNEQIEKQSSGASTKRPRGKAQKAEGEESHAVEGSILLGGADLDIFGANGNVGIDRTDERRATEVFDQDETKRALDQIRKQRERERNKKEEDDSDDEYLNKLKKRQRKNNSYAKKDSEDSGDLSKLEDRPQSGNRKRNNRNSGRKKSNGPVKEGQKTAQASGDTAKPNQKNKRNNRSRNRNKNKTSDTKKQES
ncbi:MAG: 2Fe-2S iron-sulfur cluster-binding protein [Bdellovibrionales bacterium]